MLLHPNRLIELFCEFLKYPQMCWAEQLHSDWFKPTSLSRSSPAVRWPVSPWITRRWHKRTRKRAGLDQEVCKAEIPGYSCSTVYPFGAFSSPCGGCQQHAWPGICLQSCHVTHSVLNRSGETPAILESSQNLQLDLTHQPWLLGSFADSRTCLHEVPSPFIPVSPHKSISFQFPFLPASSPALICTGWIWNSTLWGAALPPIRRTNHTYIWIDTTYSLLWLLNILPASKLATHCASSILQQSWTWHTAYLSWELHFVLWDSSLASFYILITYIPTYFPSHLAPGHWVSCLTHPCN